MKARKFDRFNQPVRCRMCSKLTTWSEVNGYSGLDLCGPCFDAAGAENERLDGHVEAAAAPVDAGGHAALEAAGE